MKIEGSNKTGSSKGVSKGKKASKASDSSFGSMVSNNTEIDASESAHVSTSAPISNLGALLAVQEDGRRGSKEANKRAKQRADEILKQLDKVKLGILRGDLPKSNLEELSRIISRSRENDIDPKLSEILDEIYLRAQVELAKYNR